MKTMITQTMTTGNSALQSRQSQDSAVLRPNMHHGKVTGEFRVIRWDMTVSPAKSQMTPVFGVSKAEADSAAWVMNAATVEGIEYRVHGAGVPVPPMVAPKPTPKDVADGEVKTGRNRADLRGKSVKEKAAYLYPSTEFIDNADGSVTVCSPVSGDEYDIDDHGDCTCEAFVACWHQQSVVIRSVFGGDVRRYCEANGIDYAAVCGGAL